MTRKYLLVCGILAMLWYTAINIAVPARYPGYDMASQAVSELSAIDAPTRSLWVTLCIFYSFLFLAFGLGTWQSATGNRNLKFVAIVIIIDAVIGIYWPPMHRREIIAAGGGTLTDTLHLTWAFIHLVLMLLMIGFGAVTIPGNSFRIFSLLIVLTFIIFGILTTQESAGIESNHPTPNLGIWERINIGAYMFWVIVYAILLIKRNNKIAV